MMNLSTPPDAFMAMDDETVLDIVHLALRKNIRIHDALGIIGMNGVEFSEDVIPSIASIHYHFD